MLQTIQPILHIYETGDNPVLVECNDLNSYVCKHNRGQTPAKKLFAEWMSHALLEGMGVVVAPKELVHVRAEHVEPSRICQPVFFREVPLFATRFLDEALEWSQFNLRDTKLIVNKKDILRIAFLDLWLANEDRNWNNFNILTHPIKKGWQIVPIDHGACFNSLMFQEGGKLVQLSDSESLVVTDEFRKLAMPLLKSMKDANDFVESLYLCIPDLEKIYDEHVLAIPSEWNISKSYSDALRGNLFHKDWLIETKSHFLSLIKSSFSIK